jgi:hypothetical protein
MFRYGNMWMKELGNGISTIEIAIWFSYYYNQSVFINEKKRSPAEWNELKNSQTSLSSILCRPQQTPFESSRFPKECTINRIWYIIHENHDIVISLDCIHDDERSVKSFSRTVTDHFFCWSTNLTLFGD